MANFVGDTTREQLLERPLPHSAESERAILGAIILDNGVINQAIELLKPEDLYVRAHYYVFRAMITLSERGSEINQILLGEELRREGLLEAVGGLAFISNLTYGLPHFANISHYAEMVRGKSMLRQLIKASNKITSEALEEEDPPEVILDHAEQAIFALAEERTRQGFAHVKPIADQLLEKVQEMSGRAVMLTGLTTGFRDLDQITSGLQPSDLIVIAARPSMGKCSAYWTLIDDPETGERLTIEEWVQQRKNVIFGISQTGQVRQTAISDWIDSGVKPVYKVTTRIGRHVEVTGHHPFLTVNGWKPLHDLAVGHKIAVPRSVPAFGKQDSLPRDMVRLMAYFIAEGGLTHVCPMFTNTDPTLVEDFKTISARQFPSCVVRQAGITYKVVRPTRTLWKSSPNPVTVWLRELKLWGKSAEHKQFPRCVWSWTREYLAEFLRVLLSCDGTIYSMRGYPRIEFAVASERLAEDVHHALTRFGIIAKLWRKSERCWRVEITEPESVTIYQEQIGWIGEKASRFVQDVRSLSLRRSNNGHAPREAWELVKTAAAQHGLSLTELARRSGEAVPSLGYNPHTNRGIPRHRLIAYTNLLADVNLQRIAGSDIYWDEIISIESIGDHQVYDLTVPDGANFIAQDMCVHNTSLCLNIAENAALRAQAVVGVFSLEMSKESLVMRMLCSEGRIDAHRFRSGFLSRQEWGQLANALGTLSEAKIFIDDTPGISVLEMRAKARRLAAEQKRLDLIIVDYLQLMSGSSRRVESRQQEVSQISRELKGLAKELNVPLVALSQLSRAPEARSDHKPQLSDLRESGCLAGDSLVTMADTGAEVLIRELVGQSGFAVWALNEETLKIERAIVSRAFSTGVKPLYRLTTKLGRFIKATGNHKFRTLDGWKRLDEIETGERLALPRIIPSPASQSMTNAEIGLLGHLIGDGCMLPRHVIQYTTKERDLAETVSSLATEMFGREVEPRISQERQWFQVYLSSTRHHTHSVRSAIAEWLDQLGAWGLRSYEKFVPGKVFEQPQAAVALFLRHLWATGGCIWADVKGKHHPGIYYASSSEQLAKDVQSLLLRFGINARLRHSPQVDKGREQHHVIISGKSDIENFAGAIGAVGLYKTQALNNVTQFIARTSANTNRDAIPSAVWTKYVLPAMERSNITTRQMMAGIGTAYCGTGIYKQNISRERAARISQAVFSDEVNCLAHSDVYWDEIAAIELLAEAEVFDLTVEKHHNFIANNLICHNSIEQDADVVAFIYREEQYNRTEENAGHADILVAKQRNGPTGTVRLAFLKEFTRFEDAYFE